MKAPTAHALTTVLAVDRVEGQTRESAIAKRKMFVRAGFVKGGALPRGSARRERPAPCLGGLQNPAMRFADRPNDACLVERRTTLSPWRTRVTGLRSALPVGCGYSASRRNPCRDHTSAQAGTPNAGTAEHPITIDV
jgi:hypothetical protein